MPEENEPNESRVRINLKQTAKGEVYFDITSEFKSVDESVENLGLALEKTKALCIEKKLRLVDSAA